MFGPVAVKSLVLKLIDEKLGKRFKVVDDITDIFQGLEPKGKDNEADIKKIKKILKENKLWK